jgi:hypothetical protein
MVQLDVPSNYCRNKTHKVVIAFSPVAWGRPFDPNSVYTAVALQSLRMWICGPRAQKMCRVGAR